ncbi:MAG: endonuclease III, partial [Armatimonadetes bacterium]|nr:endonuclease III [Armatimonadota bacterium]
MPSDKERVKEIIRILKEQYPDPRKGMLNYSTPFELLIATILAAQCTDVKVNQVTQTLFKKYPTPASFAKADPRVLEQEIRSTGFFRQKTRSIMEAAQDIMDEFGGEIPHTME